MVFGGGGKKGSQDVFVSAFDPRLRPLFGTPAQRPFPPRVNPPDGKRPSDQFLPTAATDPMSGALWACFYTSGSGVRRSRATFVCTVSDDGGRTWPTPRAAASAASDETQAHAGPFEYGDYEGLVVAGGVAHPFWTDSRRLNVLNEEIFTTRLKPVG